MNKFVSKPTGYTPIMNAPRSVREGAVKMVDLNPFTVVRASGTVNNGYEFVTCAVGKTLFAGWVDARYIEEYFTPLESNIVDLTGIATEDPTDPAQNVVWDREVQRQMCGEICCGYVLGYSLATILTRWKQSKPSVYRRIFGTRGIASGTYNSDLQTIFEMFDEPCALVNSKTHAYYTPQVVYDLRGAIVGVRLNTATGKLNGSGVGHWVVIVDIERERAGGIVTLFDPYQFNGLRRVSYDEFLASARQPFGVRSIK